MTRGAISLPATWKPSATGAFEQMYDAYQPAVLRYLVGMCSDMTLAEELTQEVFVRAATNLLLFRGESAVSTWLFRIARNTYLQWVDRQHDTRINTSQFLTLPDQGMDGNPEAQLLRQEQRTTIRQVFGMLPERQRTIVLLRDLEAFSYAEIALILDMSLAAVKVNLHRARLRFREVYAMIEGSCDD